MNRTSIAKKTSIATALLGLLLATSGGAGAVDLILIGADTGATASAVAKCGVGEASAHARAAGTLAAGASASAHVWPTELTSDVASEAGNGVATSDAAATGVGVGYASASASASGRDGSSARAAHSCDLRPIYAIILQFIAKDTDGLTLGCTATQADGEAAYDGRILADPVTGALWLVGTAARDGETSAFAAPLGDGLVLTATQAATLAPPALQDTGLAYRAAFTAVDGERACESVLSG